MDYIVVLFKNKKKKKIINKFKNKSNAINFFNKTISNNKVYFNRILSFSMNSEFELGLLEKNNDDFENHYYKDKLGRQIKMNMENSEYKLIKVSIYNIEENIVDHQTNKRIKFLNFIDEYLKNFDTLKLVFILNNKIFVQYDDKFYMFSLKSESESFRFLECVSTYLIDNNRTDCLLVNDTSKFQKKYLYNLLEKNGFSKSILYKKYTTYLK